MLINYKEAVRRMTVMDVAVLKLCVVSFTLMAVKFWPALMSLEWYCYAGLFVPSYAYLLWRLVLRKPNTK